MKKIESDSSKRKMNSIFRPETLQQLKKSRFTGRLTIEWIEGKVDYFKVSSSICYRRNGRSEDNSDFFEM